jgi:uncharacterized membrane protein YesL
VFKRVFNSYFYGKSGKGDFEKDDLPRNRWQLFWEMFRIRFTSFFKLNIIALPFFLPTLVVIVLIINSLLGYGAILQQVQEGADTVTPEMLALVDGDVENLYGLILSGLIWLIPAITISGPGQAGLAYVTRNWARDEHAFVFSDFKDAVKENWKQSLLFSLITSLLPAALFLGWVFYGQMAQNNWIWLIPKYFLLSVGLLWSLILCYAYPMLVTYQLPFTGVLRNSLLMAVGKLPQTVGIRLAALIPMTICVVVSLFTPYSLFALMFLGGYYVLMGYAVSRFLFASVSNAAFDQLLNPRIEGAEVGRGLKKDDDDLDFEDFEALNDNSEAQD